MKTLNDPEDILIRLRNPLMLLKGDYDRAADLIERLQNEVADLKRAAGSAYPDHIDHVERDIIDCVVRDALAAGYSISVDGDGVCDLKRTTDYHKITSHIAACSETEIYLWNDLLSRPLWVYFVHGNGAEVLSDYTSTERTEAIVARANELAEKLSA